ARRACCNKEIFSIDFSEYKNIISEISSTKSELKRIGNNINQIAKHLNENKNNQTKELMSDYQNQLENFATEPYIRYNGYGKFFKRLRKAYGGF
ncbi:MobC family plasmid mobilization relaxosome protein, partial [Lactococcus lactis]|uniref:MobC family plasmid mobilization relaxosome protein n=1 Tax=Lactococcus lactis TaxID=1358 RepID=UPI00223BB1A5